VRKMIMLIAVLILESLTGIQAGCPVRCNCSENSVTCVSENLEHVPYFESLTNSPVIIDLSGSSISIVDMDDFSFDKSDQVKEIYLNNSKLVTIEEKAFEELENLQELYLRDNFLNSLPENFISTNENMILLDISSNYFIDMPKITSQSLEVLAIANSKVLRPHLKNNAMKLMILLTPGGDEDAWEMEELLKNIDSPQDLQASNPVITSNKYIGKSVEFDDIYFTDFNFSVLLCFAIVSSLVIGAICGSCVTYKLITGNIKQTESWKELLTSDENFA
ncbi:slit-like, partial [Asbolus verrucosus]